MGCMCDLNETQCYRYIMLPLCSREGAQNPYLGHYNTDLLFCLTSKLRQIWRVTECAEADNNDVLNIIYFTNIFFLNKSDVLPRL